MNLSDGKQKDMTNIEISLKDDATKVVREIYRVYKSNESKVHLFIRFMIYNNKSKIVSCLQLINTLNYSYSETVFS